MAINWTFDTLGSKWTEDDAGQIVYQRKATAQNLTPGSVQAIMREIYDDAGFIARDAVLDATNWALTKRVGFSVERIDCDRGSNKPIAYCTFTYKSGGIGFSTDPDDDGDVIVSQASGLEETETYVDKDDTQITVTHEGVVQPVAVRIFVPVATIECRRLEATNPRSRAATHVGSVNDAIWNGYAARTVLCEAIESTTDDGGDSYNSLYRFAYKAETWDASVIYRTPDGKPVQSPVAGVGEKDVRIYPETNFGAMNITL